MTHRIMVIDDEPQVRELLCLYLMKQGFAVSSASSGTEALSLLKKKPADVAVLDIGLAGDDGLTLLPILKSKHKKLKVVMLTGMGYVEDFLQEAHQKGADGYVSKGLPMDELLQAIDRVLERDTVSTVARR